VEYTGIGFEATPRVVVNGTTVAGTVATAPVDAEQAARRARDLGTRGTGEHNLLSATAELREGDNTVEILGGDFALDIDYLEITPARR
jgi:hypothetical protein